MFYIYLYREIKFAIKKPVQVEAKVVDTLPGKLCYGWRMLRPIYEFEYNNEVYRIESPVSMFNSEYDIPKEPFILRINPDNPYEYIDGFLPKLSKGTIIFIGILFIIFIILYIYLNVAI